MLIKEGAINPVCVMFYDHIDSFFISFNPGGLISKSKSWIRCISNIIQIIFADKFLKNQMII